MDSTTPDQPPQVTADQVYVAHLRENFAQTTASYLEQIAQLQTSLTIAQQTDRQKDERINDLLRELREYRETLSGVQLEMAPESSD